MEGLSPVQVSLPLAAARAIVAAALAAGREHEMMPLTVAVLDAGGHLVALEREDGSGILRVEIAFAKAYGSIGMGMSTRLIRDRLSDRPVFLNAITAASGGRLAPAPGGVLALAAAGEVLGAVGVSGDTSDRDEFCAIAGIRAAGLVPEPVDPAPDWNGSSL